MEKRKIVFYDGECGFCNRIVKFVLKNDSDKVIYFTSIQSDFTKELFESNNWETPSLNTFYYLNNGLLFQKSQGAIKLSQNLRFPFKMLIVFLIVPKKIRDGMYDFIAKRRKKIFNDFCYLPTKADVNRFIY